MAGGALNEHVARGHPGKPHATKLSVLTPTALRNPQTALLARFPDAGATKRRLLR